MISCEIQTPYEGLDGMLLDKNGKLTMRKVKASCLSLQLHVESAVVTYDECQGNLLDHPTNSAAHRS